MKKLFGLALVAFILGSVTPTPLRLLRPEVPLLAQSPGFTNWVNIHTQKVAADFTDGNGVTTLQNIPGLSLTLPAGVALTYQIDCDLFYSQATNVADTFGVQFTGNSPTNAQIGGFAFTNATAIAAGTPATISNTTATTTIAFTPAVTTVLYAHMGGAAEIPNNAVDTVLNIMVAQSTAANVIVVKRGSICRWSGMP